MTESLSILKADNLVKKYGNFKALDGFTCDIPNSSDGRITGLLGPNGAGKTTFIHSMLGITKFSKGSISCMGYKLPQDLLLIKDQLGYMPERQTSILKTSAMKFVTHFGRLAGIPKQNAKQRAFDVLHYVGLEEARYRNLEEYSTGMLQRVKLAVALVNDPALIILDEPTAGMDPPGREKMLTLISDLGHNHGKSIIMSTHLLPDVERCVDFVILISQGKRLMQGKLENILRNKEIKRTKLKIRVDKNNLEFGQLLDKNNFVIESITSSNITCVVDSTEDKNYLVIFQLAKEHGFVIRSLTPHSQSLEEVFLEAYQNEENLIR